MRSPYLLLQEELQRDPWKIFVCCIFCNLTKRRTAEPYFWKVLDRWPDPSAMSKADIKDLESIIQPLGLSKRRSNALIRMSKDYMQKDWQDNPESLYGIGKYAADAYRIFVLDQWESVDPKDGALVNYVNWRRNEHIYT